VGGDEDDEEFDEEDTGDEYESDGDDAAEEVIDLSGSEDEGEEGATNQVDEKLRPLLEPGDHIVTLYCTARMSGMDTVKGLLLVTERNMYIVDGFTLAGDAVTGDGASEVVEMDPGLEEGTGNGDGDGDGNSSARAHGSSKGSKKKKSESTKVKNVVPPSPALQRFLSGTKLAGAAAGGAAPSASSGSAAASTSTPLLPVAAAAAEGLHTHRTHTVERWSYVVVVMCDGVLCLVGLPMLLVVGVCVWEGGGGGGAFAWSCDLCLWCCGRQRVCACLVVCVFGCARARVCVYAGMTSSTWSTSVGSCCARWLWSCSPRTDAPR